MKPKINLGDLKHLIEVQELRVTTDEYGFQKEQWTTLFKARAKIDFDKSYKLNKEVWSADGIETITTKIFTFRKVPNVEVNVKQRIKYKDYFYQICVCNDLDEEGRFIMAWGNRIC